MNVIQKLKPLTDPIRRGEYIHTGDGDYYAAEAVPVEHFIKVVDIVDYSNGDVHSFVCDSQSTRFRSDGRGRPEVVYTPSDMQTLDYLEQLDEANKRIEALQRELLTARQEYNDWFLRHNLTDSSPIRQIVRDEIGKMQK
jgi:hypothetical protein